MGHRTKYTYVKGRRLEALSMKILKSEIVTTNTLKILKICLQSIPLEFEFTFNM